MAGISFTNNEAKNFEKLEGLITDSSEPVERAIFWAIPSVKQQELIFERLSKFEDFEIVIESPNQEPLLFLTDLPHLENVKKLVLKSGWKASSLDIIAGQFPSLEILEIDFPAGAAKKLSLEPLSLIKNLNHLEIHKVSNDLEKLIEQLELNSLCFNGCKKKVPEIRPKAKLLSFAGCGEEFISSFKSDSADSLALGNSRSIEALRVLDGFHNVNSLTLYELHKVSTLNKLTCAKGLKHLRIRDLKNLKLDTSLKEFKKLRYLRIIGNSALDRKQLNVLHKLPELKKGQIRFGENGKIIDCAGHLEKISTREEKEIFHTRFI